MPSVNRQFRLQNRPKGILAPADLQLSEVPIPALGEGQALARVRYLSMDPTMRVWMSDRPQYMPPVALGDVMRGFGLAEIEESRSSDWKKGDRVVGLTGLQDFVRLDDTEKNGFRRIPDIPSLPDPAFLGVLGITGLTAYFGITDIAKPQPAETLVVSAAAGATGSIAGQIAKILGCHVVGIAGGEEKCRWLTEELGFDAAVDYKRSGWKDHLAAATPRGIDINFENVGGEIMHKVLNRMNLFGRVVLCGLISGYTREDPALASFATVLIKRLRVQGFLIIDYADKFTEAATQLGKWKMSGNLKDRETIIEGLEKAPDAINMLFAGQNIGKLLVKL
jgi:NADPH-dependent curcumin reductase